MTTAKKFQLLFTVNNTTNTFHMNALLHSPTAMSGGNRWKAQDFHQLNAKPRKFLSDAKFSKL